MTTKMVSHAANLGNEFSSDEETDQVGIRQNVRPMPPLQQQQKIIVNIETLGDINANSLDLNDEQLLEMLDRFDISHGPVVESTRSLYKRVLINHLKKQQHQGETTSSSERNQQQPESLSSHHAPPIQAPEVYSSDDDDVVYDGEVEFFNSPEDGELMQWQKKVQNKQRVVVPMEVDLDPHMDDNDETEVTTEEDDYDEDDEDDEVNSEDETTSDEKEDDGDDLTKQRMVNYAGKKDQAKTDLSSKSSKTSTDNMDKSRPRVKITPMRPTISKQQSASQQTVATSTTQSVGLAKKPFTRSQRAAASSASSTTNSVTKQGSDLVNSGKSSSTSRFTFKRILIVLLVAIVAIFVAYYFRSRLAKSSPGGMSIPSFNL